tara:strand:- start:675 stop:884 length:210 start_codon:yes stop_codon:yes gene_type:complete
MKAKQYKILTDTSASGLQVKVQPMLEIGWELKGGHSVVEKHHQCQYAGMQHKQTVIRSEYSQTLVKYEK